MSIELKQKEKIITLNNDLYLEKDYENIKKYTIILINFMINNAQQNYEIIEYFRFKYTDSEKSINSKDLVLKWAVSEKNRQ